MRNIKPKRENYMSPGVGALKKGKPKAIYPTIRMDLEHIPEAKKWKVGSTYRIEVVAKMVGLSQSRFDNSAEFEIRKIDTGDAEPAEDDADESETESEDGKS